ncbi:alpha/beta hydrolase [Catellatospora sp. NPDC049111]|uniref:alpha/beta fold hydrolase n=1 Tax=Catellatospora sp. NPDC049111 TaxID=3155271 RepID=UPI0033C00E02
MTTYFGSDGAALHYDELNHDGGTPVVALAGGAALHPRYLGDLAGLPQRLIVPHLRGVGLSPLPESVQTASYWRQAEDLEQLRVHLGLDRLLLLGHSAGTRLAISYAARFPDRVTGLVLITPPASYLVDEPSDTPALIDARRGDPAFDAAVAAWSAGPASTDDDAFNAWYRQAAPLGYASWGEREQAHAATARYNYAANRAYFSVEPPADLAWLLGKVTAPVLVVAGAQDCSAGLAPVRALSALFPAAEFAVIDQCGHHPWVEQPTEFRATVDRFLRCL